MKLTLTRPQEAALASALELYLEHDPTDTDAEAVLDLLNYDETEEEAAVVPDLDLRVSLGMIEYYSRYARRALADEEEGNVRHYVEQLAGLASQSRALVRTW